MKHKLGLVLAVLIGLSVASGLAVQKEQESREEQIKEMFDAAKGKIQNPRPAGVFSENWIPLSANAGIALNPQKTKYHRFYTGRIMVKDADGLSWTELVIENSVFLQPLKGD